MPIQTERSARQNARLSRGIAHLYNTSTNFDQTHFLSQALPSRIFTEQVAPTLTEASAITYETPVSCKDPLSSFPTPQNEDTFPPNCPFDGGFDQQQSTFSLGMTPVNSARDSTARQDEPGPSCSLNLNPFDNWKVRSV